MFRRHPFVSEKPLYTCLGDLKGQAQNQTILGKAGQNNNERTSNWKMTQAQ